MQIEYVDNEIEAATDEEFACKYAGVLMQAMIETSAETQVSICLLMDGMIRTIILNSQRNGHGACATIMLKDAIKLLSDLETADAKERRH